MSDDLVERARVGAEKVYGTQFFNVEIEAAIAVALEEAAKVAENASFHFTQTTPSTVEVVDVRHTIAAAIRALVKT